MHRTVGIRQRLLDIDDRAGALRSGPPGGKIRQLIDKLRLPVIAANRDRGRQLLRQGGHYNTGEQRIATLQFDLQRSIKIRDVNVKLVRAPRRQSSGRQSKTIVRTDDIEMQQISRDGRLDSIAIKYVTKISIQRQDEIFKLPKGINKSNDGHHRH